MSMKICFIELRDDLREAGQSLGALSIVNAVRNAGHTVDIADETCAGYDIELISVHFYTSYEKVKRMPQKAKFRILGGSPMKNNPLPLIPFCDAICVGEGETWIVEALSLLEQTNKIESLSGLSGTIISNLWKRGDSIPKPNYEKSVPNNPAFLREGDGKNRAWVLELSRGCPYNCKFCMMPSDGNFRCVPLNDIKTAIDNIDFSTCRSIDFIAAESGSHPYFCDIIDYLKEKGITYRFGSSIRIEQFMRGKIATVSNNKLRIGVDGLSEETRFHVGKRISDDMIYEFFKMAIEKGHVSFKIYMVIGYPWETPSRFEADFKKFDALIERIKNLALRKNIIIEINWTPLLPLKGTPLEGAIPTYNYDMYEKIAMWHVRNRHPQKTKGLYIKEILPSVPWQYQKLLKIAVGDETLFLPKRNEMRR